MGRRGVRSLFLCLMCARFGVVIGQRGKVSDSEIISHDPCTSSSLRCVLFSLLIDERLAIEQ